MQHGGHWSCSCLAVHKCSIVVRLRVPVSISVPTVEVVICCLAEVAVHAEDVYVVPRDRVLQGTDFQAEAEVFSLQWASLHGRQLLSLSFLLRFAASTGPISGAERQIAARPQLTFVMCHGMAHRADGLQPREFIVSRCDTTAGTRPRSPLVLSMSGR